MATARFRIAKNLSFLGGETRRHFSGTSKNEAPILVTGAAGSVGSVGFKIVELLRAKSMPVRAMVRQFDSRSEALSKLGAEVVKGDLTNLQDVHQAIKGCKRLYFGMSVSASYLEATANVAAVAKHYGVECFLNISQMTVSQMSIHETTSSPQQKLHWLSEQVLNWSGLPVVHVRATVFLEHFFFYKFAAQTIKKSGELRVPFGMGRTSPIATLDVARVMVEILTNPTSHIGKVYDITGPKSQNLYDMAKEYSEALGTQVKYVDIPLEQWKTENQSKVDGHVFGHIYTMAKLHRENRYDRMVTTVEEITGSKPLSVKEWVKANIKEFQ